MSDTTRVHERGDVELAYDIIDHAQPWVTQPQTIVFHHGLGACSQCWRGWFPDLLARYRLVVFDMRGHGGSRLSESDASPVTLEHLVADLDAIVTDLAGGSCHVVGESIGGTIALAYASRHPERVRSLTVSNGAHLGGSLDKLADWRERISDGGMVGWSAHMMTMRFAEDAIEDDMWRWYCEQQATADPDFVLSALDALRGADLSEELSSITAPVLLMHPDDSPFIPIDVTLDLKRKLSDVRVQVFAGTRHGLPFSHATRCARVLREFLAAVG